MRQRPAREGRVRGRPVLRRHAIEEIEIRADRDQAAELSHDDEDQPAR
jgi:hypothetical protein